MIDFGINLCKPSTLINMLSLKQLNRIIHCYFNKEILLYRTIENKHEIMQHHVR